MHFSHASFRSICTVFARVDSVRTAPPTGLAYVLQSLQRFGACKLIQKLITQNTIQVKPLPFSGRALCHFVCCVTKSKSNQMLFMQTYITNDILVSGGFAMCAVYIHMTTRTLTQLIRVKNNAKMYHVMKRLVSPANADSWGQIIN